MEVPLPAKPPGYWSIFFELYESLPRQGPGNRASTARALGLCPAVPENPRFADFGCGSGASTLLLAELVSGCTIEALDAHAPLIARLQRTVLIRHLDARIHPHVGDMNQPPFAPNSFDLIWCEGALYNLGVARGLERWRPLLRGRGCVVFTEAVWLRDDPPDEVKALWAEEYPQLADVPANLAIIADSGYEAIAHFTLPAEAWWDDFYTPMDARIRELRTKHAGNGDAQTTLTLLQREVDMHRQFGDWYGYEFFVTCPR